MSSVVLDRDPLIELASSRQRFLTDKQEVSVPCLRRPRADKVGYLQLGRFSGLCQLRPSLERLECDREIRILGGPSLLRDARQIQRTDRISGLAHSSFET